MLNQKIIISDIEACTGCRMCELVCSLKNEKTGINPEKSNIRIIDDNQKGIYTPASCQFCNEAKCIEACPSSAIAYDSLAGVICIDREKCTGCGICADSCDYDVIFVNEKENTAVACDLCGGDPQCVKYCMPKALEFLKQDEFKFNKK